MSFRPDEDLETNNECAAALVISVVGLRNAATGAVSMPSE
jgi:hypothetical protein